mmetsp:Transcript_12592/g.20333  ORF Transcript_12592/g.20333 Transcript_12592/m.20333 type:complete len:420 (-) Transcript_12592:2065-3324(-)
MKSKDVSSLFRELKARSTLEPGFGTGSRSGRARKLVLSNRQGSSPRSKKHHETPGVRVIDVNPEQIINIRRSREGAVYSRPESLPPVEPSRPYSQSYAPPDSSSETLHELSRAAHSVSVTDTSDYSMESPSSNATIPAELRTVDLMELESKGKDPKQIANDLKRLQKQRRDAEREEKENLLRRRNQAAIIELEKRQRKRGKVLDELERETVDLGMKIAKAIETLGEKAKLGTTDKLEHCKELCDAIEAHFESLAPIQEELKASFLPSLVQNEVTAVMDRVLSQGKQLQGEVVKDVQEKANTFSRKYTPEWMTALCSSLCSSSKGKRTVSEPGEPVAVADDDDEGSTSSEDDEAFTNEKEQLLKYPSSRSVVQEDKPDISRVQPVSSRSCVSRSFCLMLLVFKLAIAVLFISFVIICLNM